MSEDEIRILAKRSFMGLITDKTRFVRSIDKIAVYYRIADGRENKCCELRLFQRLDTGAQIAMEYAPEIDTLFWDDFS